MRKVTSFVIVVLLASFVVPASSVYATHTIQKTMYVSPSGSDTSGYGTSEQPYRTISYALSLARAGVTIIVREGVYKEYIKTVRNARSDSPITLSAEGQVILTGGGTQNRIMDLKHDYYHVTGFEFTGRDILLRLYEADYSVIEGNYFHHAQGECIRVKYQSSNNVISRNRIEYCGLRDFGGGGTGKNGEGIYLGTAPEQVDLNKTRRLDRTSYNVIQDNMIVTHGAECTDIKEGSDFNTVEFNDCSGQLDPNSAGFASRGNRNTFRYNRSYDNTGAGIRFGGDLIDDGVDNEAYGNELFNNQNVALKVMRLPQGLICGNVAYNNSAFSNEATIQNPPCDFQLSQPGIQL